MEIKPQSPIKGRPLIQNQNQILGNLERDIESTLSINKYQVRILLHSLKLQKSQYEITRVIKDNHTFVGADEDEEEDYEEEYYDLSYVNSVKLEVYDTLKQKKTFLVIYYLKHSLPLEAILKVQVETVQSMPQTDLVLKPIDCYVLDPFVSYDKPEFMVIEYEMFDLTLIEFCIQYSISRKEIEEYLIKQAKTVEDISQIKVTTNREILFNRYYACINQQSNSLEIKLDVLGLTNENNDEIEEYYGVRKSKNTISEPKVAENVVEKMNTLSPEKDKLAEFYVSHLKESNFAELANRKNRLIAKDTLLAELQLSVPLDVFSTYNPLIFEAISNDPNYLQFELVFMNKDHFLFNVLKADQQVCYLEGEKVKSLEDSSKLEQQYQSLIAHNNSTNMQINNKKLSTLSSVSLTNLLDSNYLLIENKVRVSRFNYSYVTLDYYLRTNYKQDYQSVLKLLFQLFELSKQLFFDHAIQITSIKPSNIVEIKKQSNFSEEKKLSEGLYISHLDYTSNFTEDYIDIAGNIFRMMIPHRLDLFIVKAVKKFFESISRDDQESVQKIYLKIKHTIDRLSELTQLGIELKATYKNINVNVYLESDGDQIENVFAIIQLLKGFDLKGLYEILNKHQFNHIIFDTQKQELKTDYNLPKTKSTLQFQTPHFNSLFDPTNTKTDTEAKTTNSGFFSNLSNLESYPKKQQIAEQNRLFADLMIHTRTEAQQGKPSLFSGLESFANQLTNDKQDVESEKTGLFSSIFNPVAKPSNEETTQKTGLFSNLNNNLNNLQQEIKPQQTGLFSALNNNDYLNSNQQEIKPQQTGLFSNLSNTAGLFNNEINTSKTDQISNIFQNPSMTFKTGLFSNLTNLQQKPQLSQEEICLVQKFFSTQENPKDEQVITLLQDILNSNEFKLELEIIPYQIDYNDLNFQKTDKADNDFRTVNDELIECSQCLQLTFTRLSINKSAVIKFILTKNSYIVVESQSPLIGTYQNPAQLDRKVFKHFHSAYKFQDWNRIFNKGNFDFQQCCSLQEQTSLFFKLLENQCNLKILSLNLLNKNYPTCKKFAKINYPYFKNLQFIQFRDSNGQMELTRSYFGYLRELISLFKNVNTVYFNLSDLGKTQGIHLLNQMYKIRNLVSLTIEIR